MRPTYTHYCASPLGVLSVSGNDDGIVGVSFCEQAHIPRDALVLGRDFLSSSLLPTPLYNLSSQLFEYFEGKRQVFHSLPLVFRGTAFQHDVFDAVSTIIFGGTASYGEIAEALGDPQLARAVGQAISRNPLAIIVPCHRILPERGGLGGYAWGAWRKAWLLQHEAM